MNGNLSRLNENIIYSSNFEYHRTRSLSTISHSVSDIKIDGQYNFYLSPSKRKIDRADIGDNIPNTGKLVFDYTDNSNVFYMNNKLQIVNTVTNRYCQFNNVNIVSNTLCKNISNPSGISLSTIREEFLTCCCQKMPVNVLTVDPIIYEVMYFIISNFVYRDIHFVDIPIRCYNKYSGLVQILIHYVTKCKEHGYNRKTHSCLIRNNKDCNTVVNSNNTRVTNIPYTFSDQYVVICDNNFNYTCPPIIKINIPVSAIDRKCNFLLDTTQKKKKIINNNNKKLKLKRNHIQREEGRRDIEFVLSTHPALKAISNIKNYFKPIEKSDSVCKCNLKK